MYTVGALKLLSTIVLAVDVLAGTLIVGPRGVMDHVALDTVSLFDGFRVQVY